ncbi:TIGR03619 family F420-dependent LLM class oxidoreductase [Trujillonella endophytica]|uniref:Probable F420-dependent oxidoreductase, Rv2161c family n=1 Tax=Trujillonella endophytica TaxID=673521 RepID=A0A1H8VQL0_9ACTN|nr:TIGR03619 family F420-dependent LLM class oxidoreductase [Trujillella endophytica]SEP17614.1 probable F420-dependent oxidoreductase, Rv2161c family [Trujillella endophytica]
MPSSPEIGLLYFATDRSMPLLDVARAAAERGFDSLLLPEHTHIPVSTASSFPRGGAVPERYLRTLDPYVALAMMAAETDLRIGTCVALVAQHDPIALAKTVATLDHLSGGRFTLGVGYGWNVDELANHGRDPRRRRAIVREHVAAMRALWRDEQAEFQGEHVTLSPSWAWPKPPPERPVPVLLGCSPTPRGYESIVEWADGWIPAAPSPELLADWLATLRAQWELAGRDAAGPVVWTLQGPADDDTLARHLDRYRELGVHQVVLDLQTVPREELLPTLDRYAAVVSAHADGR